MHAHPDDNFISTRDIYANGDDAPFVWSKWSQIPVPPHQFEEYGPFCLIE